MYVTGAERNLARITKNLAGVGPVSFMTKIGIWPVLQVVVWYVIRAMDEKSMLLKQLDDFFLMDSS